MDGFSRKTIAAVFVQVEQLQVSAVASTSTDRQVGSDTLTRTWYKVLASLVVKKSTATFL